MKKVIFYSPLFIKGGMETAVYHLIRTLIELGDYEVQVLYRSETPLSEGITKQLREICDVRCVYDTSTRVKWGAMYKPQKNLEFTGDVLINCSNWDFNLPFIKVKKTINWIHGTKLLKPLPYGQRTVVVQSEWQAPFFRDEGVQVNVLPNIMDEKKIRALAKETPQFAANAKGPVFMVVSRISAEKGWSRLVEFMKRECNKDAICYVAGVPFNEEGVMLQKGVEDCLKDQVVFMGEIGNPYPYMKQADYVLVLSDFETFGLTSMEAHILGTPVVFNRFETAKDQFIEGFDQWFDTYEPTKRLTHDYVDKNKQSVIERWEEIINAN